jgi:hypothetical protein
VPRPALNCAAKSSRIPNQVNFHFRANIAAAFIGHTVFSLLTVIRSVYETIRASKCGQTTCAKTQENQSQPALRSEKKQLLEASQ